MLVLLEQLEAVLDAAKAEGVAAVWEQNGQSVALVVDLTTKSALNLFYVHCAVYYKLTLN